ncbi:hypothetical protein An01g05930 [Aspergillus niger]|uniref:Uncharacterized protein n=2 Tax=Aspergillus niger TaxID=5061 RepID=A2Q8X8_ASPNC|nr:hypothetical protein An01g05930 [Aspergillus niger]CAK37068.1 hypothetical protein An01g05930 [Aspergillus niger]
MDNYKYAQVSCSIGVHEVFQGDLEQLIIARNNHPRHHEYRAQLPSYHPTKASVPLITAVVCLMSSPLPSSRGRYTVSAAKNSKVLLCGHPLSLVALHTGPDLPR